MAAHAKHRPPLTRFVEWTDEVGVSAAARLIGCHGSFITHIRAGRKTPGLRTAAAIERATAAWPGGPIRATEWAEAEAEAA